MFLTRCSIWRRVRRKVDRMDVIAKLERLATFVKDPRRRANMRPPVEHDGRFEPARSRRSSAEVRSGDRVGRRQRARWCRVQSPTEPKDRPQIRRRWTLRAGSEPGLQEPVACGATCLTIEPTVDSGTLRLLPLRSCEKVDQLLRPFRPTGPARRVEISSVDFLQFGRMRKPRARRDDHLVRRAVEPGTPPAEWSCWRLRDAGNAPSAPCLPTAVPDRPLT